jgi:hypothetical protein
LFGYADEREGRSDQDYEDYGMRGSEEGSAPQQGEFDSGEAEDEVQNEMSDVVDEDYEEEELDGDEDEDDEPEPMWHYVEKGQKTGPVPESDLRQMVWAGKIGNTLVWTPGQKEWQQLSDFPQLLPTRAGEVHPSFSLLLSSACTASLLCAFGLSMSLYLGERVFGRGRKGLLLIGWGVCMGRRL